jgi:uncharacterized protein
MMTEAPSQRTKVKRYNQLAKYDAETIHEILDAMPMCSVGYVHEGKPVVTPTMQWRDGNRIFWHGSSASRMIRAVVSHDVCVCVSIVDGLVLARSAYNYNLNHRSVMVFGVAQQELKATTLMSLDITEASAKMRAGHTEDDEADYEFPVWAGLIPVSFNIGTPIPDPRNLPDIAMPKDVLSFQLG